MTQKGIIILAWCIGLFSGFFYFYLLNNIEYLPQHRYHIQNQISNEDHNPNHDVLNVTTVLDDKEMDSKWIEKNLSILCWIMTCPKNHNKKAKHVKATWARRCNKTLFMSTERDEKLDSIGLKVLEGRKHLWEKTQAAFKYIYDIHYNDYDWFLKADDDTYVILENLRYMLSPYNASEPIWFGSQVKLDITYSYMSGGGGYVLSREALRRFVEEAMPNQTICRQIQTGAEDLQLGHCLHNVGVIAGDSRDSVGRGRFFPYLPVFHLLPDIPGYSNEYKWYRRTSYYPAKLGLDCCSDTAVSFHYVPSEKMYELEYFLYHLRPYGIHH